MVDMSVKAVKKSTHCCFNISITLYFTVLLEMPLGGIKSYAPLYLDRGISVKWQFTVA